MQLKQNCMPVDLSVYHAGGFVLTWNNVTMSGVMGDYKGLNDFQRGFLNISSSANSPHEPLHSQVR